MMARLEKNKALQQQLAVVASLASIGFSTKTEFDASAEL